MPKTVSLRLNDEEYKKLATAAVSVKRSISNLIRFLALNKLEEDSFVDDIEMEEISGNPAIRDRLQRGEKEVRRRQGSFVDV